MQCILNIFITFSICVGVLVFYRYFIYEVTLVSANFPTQINRVYLNNFKFHKFYLKYNLHLSFSELLRIPPDIRVTASELLRKKADRWVGVRVRVTARGSFQKKKGDSTLFSDIIFNNSNKKFSRSH